MTEQKSTKSTTKKEKPQADTATAPQAVQPVPQPQPVAPQQPTYVAGPVGDQVDIKSRLAMMLLAYFALPTGLARAYIGDKMGMIRFWIYLGLAVLMIVPYVNMLAAIGMIALTVWGAIDFFTLKNASTDAFGASLSSTNRDERVIGYLNTIMIITLVVYGIALVGLLVALPFIAERWSDVYPGPYYYYY